MRHQTGFSLQTLACCQLNPSCIHDQPDSTKTRVAAILNTALKTAHPIWCDSLRDKSIFMLNTVKIKWADCDRNSMRGDHAAGSIGDAFHVDPTHFNNTSADGIKTHCLISLRDGAQKEVM